MGKLEVLVLTLLLTTIPMLKGQEIPIVPDDEEVDEAEAEQRYDALMGLSTLQLSNARFDMLRLPGMTHARARAIVTRFGDGLFPVDSIVEAMISMHTAQVFSRMVEPNPHFSPRTAVTLRSTLSFDSRRGTSRDAWESKQLFRLRTTSDDGSRMDVDVSMPTRARLRSSPRFYSLAVSAAGDVSAAAGEFRSRGRQGLLEDAHERILSMPDILSLAGDHAAFGRTSLMEPSATTRGIGVSVGAKGPVTVNGVLGISSNANRKGAVQEISIRGSMTPESQVGVTLLRLPWGIIGTSVCHATTSDRSSSKVSVLVRPDAGPAYVMTGSTDIGRDVLLAYAFHSSGSAIGVRWKQVRHILLEAFWSSDRNEESRSIWSTSRLQTIQMNVGDPAGPTGRIRLRRTVVRSEGASPSMERAVSSATGTSAVPISKRTSVSVHAQALVLREDRMKDRSSLMVLTVRHRLDALTFSVWVSSFRSTPGGTLWWQHPGYGFWPVSVAFSGSGNRAGLHVTRVRIGATQCSAYIVVGRRTSSSDRDILGGLMLESRL